jgi:hypothetical protein
VIAGKQACFFDSRKVIKKWLEIRSENKAGTPKNKKTAKWRSLSCL